MGAIHHSSFLLRFVPQGEVKHSVPLGDQPGRGLIVVVYFFIVNIINNLRTATKWAIPILIKITFVALPSAAVTLNFRFHHSP